MKRSGTAIIFVVVWAAVLLGAYGIGLCIREVRFHHAAIKPTTVVEPQARAEIQKPSGTSEPERAPAEMVQPPPQMVQAPPEIRPMPGPESGLGQRLGGPREGKAMFQMLSPEEAAELKEKWPNMSEEEREQFSAQMAERWQNLSEEERQQVIERRRAEMRERFGDRRKQGSGQGRRPGRKQQQNE